MTQKNHQLEPTARICTRFCGEISISFLIFLVAFVLSVIVDSGHLNEGQPHSTKERNCVRVPLTTGGCEDVSVFNNKKVLLACDTHDIFKALSDFTGNRTETYLAARKHKSAFFVVDPTLPDTPRNVIIKGFTKEDMNWHGVITTQYANSDWILVLNHNLEYESIEVFKFSHSDNTATYWGCIRHDELQRGFNNNLDIVDGMKGVYFTVFATNHRSPIAFVSEAIFKRRSGSVGYCEFIDFNSQEPASGDGTINVNCRMVAKTLNNPNGITLSRDEKYVFVTDDKNVAQYKRDTKTNDLVRVATHSVVTKNRNTLENLWADKEGNIWVCSHVSAVKLGAHIHNISKPSPGEVIMMKKIGTEEYAVSSVLLDDGTLLSGSATAVISEGKIFIGAVFDTAYMFCDA